MRTIKILSLLLLLLAVNKSYSQGGIFSKRNIINQYSTVGIGGGSAHYWGDLSSFRTPWLGLITTPRWNGTINYTRFLTANVGARFSFSYIRIMGDDYAYSQWNIEKFAGQYMRNLHFRNDIKEFTLTGIYNFTNQNGKGPKNRTTMFPYVFLGIGFYNHSPFAKAPVVDAGGNPILNVNGKIQKSDWVPLAPLKTSNQTTTYGAIQLVAPVGLGIRKRLNDQWDIAAEAGIRITPFDYLDDVGATLYPSVSTTGKLSYTNRSFENYEARKGESRIDEFSQVLPIFGLVGGTGVEPFANTLVGDGQQIKIRGTKAWDYYATVQITLNYILSNKIKCPPIK